MLVSGGLGPLVRPGLRKGFGDEMQNFEPEYSQFMKVGSTTMPEIQATMIAGPSRLYDLGDGEPVTYEDIVIGTPVGVVDKEFGLAIAISKRAQEDDLYNKVKNTGKWLSHSVKMTYEYRAAALLDDAFTGTDFLGWDGLPLLSTAHTLLNSSATFANRPATDVGLSITGITALLDLAHQAVDQNGDPAVINPDTLIIGNNAGDYTRALQIWYSTLEPFTAENQENGLRLRMKAKNGYMPRKEPVVSHYKTSRKSYFLVDSKQNDAEFLIRRAAQMADEEDFETGAFKSKVTTRFLLWFYNPIGWFGSNPT